MKQMGRKSGHNQASRPNCLFIEVSKNCLFDGYLGFGSPGRIRTSDPTVNSRLLYRLSYRGALMKRSELSFVSVLRRESKNSAWPIHSPRLSD